MLKRWCLRSVLWALRTAKALRVRRLDRAIKVGDADLVERHLTELERYDNDIIAYSKQLDAS